MKLLHLIFIIIISSIHLFTVCSSAKHNLKVEACIYVQDSISNNYLKFFSNDFNKMNKYFSIYFSNVIHAVNTIYSQINDDSISIQIELVKLHFHREEKFKSSYRILDDINLHFVKYYQHNQIDCDHVFYLVSTSQSAAQKIGETYPFGVCNPNYFTSIAEFKMEGLERTLAHELAHNLGADLHDDEIDEDGKKNCKGKLLNSEFGFEKNSFNLWTFSKCSIDLIKKALLLTNNNNNELNASYNCLKQENNNNKNLFKQLSNKKSYLSLSDQCRLKMIDMKSYSCYLNSNDICRGNYCYNITSKNCFSELYPIHGTPCGLNKHCQYGICMDITEPLRESNLKMKDHCIQGTDNEYLYDKNVLYEQTAVSDLKFFQECNSYLNAMKCEACLKQQYSYDYYLATRKTIFSLTCDHFNGTNPCFNDGKCMTKLNVSSFFSFYCKCTNDFTGELCLSPKHKPCDLNPCPANNDCFEYGELEQYYCFEDTIKHIKNNNFGFFSNSFDYFKNNFDFSSNSLKSFHNSFNNFFQNIFYPNHVKANNHGYNLKFSFYYWSCLWVGILKTDLF
jgi:hypothetical protein